MNSGTLAWNRHPPRQPRLPHSGCKAWVRNAFCSLWSYGYGDLDASSRSICYNNSILTRTPHRAELLLFMQHFDISLHLGSCRIFDLAMFLLRQS